MNWRQRRIQWGLWGLSPPPGPVKSIDFSVFRPQRVLSPRPPGQIPEYAPEQSLKITDYV